MNISEIKNAVDGGLVVNWANGAYIVIRDRLGRYLIKCIHNSDCIGLTNLAGDKLNGNECDFFTTADAGVIYGAAKQ